MPQFRFVPSVIATDAVERDLISRFGHIDRVHENIDIMSACCHPIDGATARFSARNRDYANPRSTPIRAGEPLPLRAAVRQPAAARNGKLLSSAG